MNFKDILPQNQEEVEKLLEQLESVEPIAINLEEDDRRILRNIFDNTWHLGLRNRIGIILVKAEDEALYAHLIRKIREYIHTKFVSPLIYCASYYDCSEDIQVFIDLLILKDDVSFADALAVFSNMGDIDKSERQYAANKLSLYFEQLPSDHHKYEYIESLIKFLNKREEQQE